MLVNVEVVNVVGQLALYSPTLKCGLVSLEQGGFCFFLAKDFLTRSPEALYNSLTVSFTRIGFLFVFWTDIKAFVAVFCFYF
jgi:hypothetical protein